MGGWEGFDFLADQPVAASRINRMVVISAKKKIALDKRPLVGHCLIQGAMWIAQTHCAALNWSEASGDRTAEELEPKFVTHHMPLHSVAAGSAQRYRNC